jgi:hypothetical protein
VAGDDFAALLWQLKERSGLSYGVLGKRLHLSGSALHRYVIGEVVPTDYAPVERFARLCRATPDELIELHRLWVRADALRQRKGPAAEPNPKPAPGRRTAREPEESASTGVVFGPDANEVSEQDTVSGSPEGLVVTGARGDAGPRRGRSRHRRNATIIGVAAAAAVSVVLVVNLLPGGDSDDGKRQTVVGAASPLAKSPDITPGPKSPSPSVSVTASKSPKPSASAFRKRMDATAASASGVAEVATAPNVAVNPFKWEGPCSQHYLVNRQPTQVPPPPSEQDASGWVGAVDAVSGGQQMLALTVQGTGKRTVVLEALRVRTVKKGPPLAWNDYQMGVGCGGDVATKSFVVDLDAARPATSPKAGQRDFPYKVSESDPEVFYVNASAEAHDVSWYLELEWSSGKQHGTVRIDHNGKPFHTSSNLGRKSYHYMLGGSEWEE